MRSLTGTYLTWIPCINMGSGRGRKRLLLMIAVVISVVLADVKDITLLIDLLGHGVTLGSQGVSQDPDLI